MSETVWYILVAHMLCQHCLQHTWEAGKAEAFHFKLCTQPG